MVRLFRVKRVSCTIGQTFRNGLTLVPVHRNDSCSSHDNKKASAAENDGEGQSGNGLSADERAEGQRQILQTAEDVNGEHRESIRTDEKSSYE